MQGLTVVNLVFNSRQHLSTDRGITCAARRGDILFSRQQHALADIQVENSMVVHIMIKGE
jgi:hypothetical protein